MTEDEAIWTVEDLIPHRGRMKLVQVLVAGGDDEAETGAVVLPSWPLHEPETDAVPALVLVELIAQSASLLTGWKRRHLEAQGGVGVLVGVREASFGCARVAVGTRLRILVRVLRSFGNYLVFLGQVFDGERLLCAAELQAFRPEGAGALPGAPQGS